MSISNDVIFGVFGVYVIPIPAKSEIKIDHMIPLSNIITEFNFIHCRLTDWLKGFDPETYEKIQFIEDATPKR